jgi:hypothetical protein
VNRAIPHVHPVPGVLQPKPRTVVVGDLNGADDVLQEILRGTRLIDGEGRWIGGDAEFIQLGDVFNRGNGARAAFELLLALGEQAESAGGRVTMLLGNHEVMIALRNEAYCTEGEYLSFASQRERDAWPRRVARAARRLYRQHPQRGPILPLGPRLDAWKVENVPGRAALRRAMRPGARFGRALRRLPAVVQRGDTVFVHGGLVPAWARLGVDGINHALAEAWSHKVEFIKSLPPRSILRADDGPLWDRSLALGAGGPTEIALLRSLRLIDARRMVIGHTATAHMPGGMRGEVLLRFSGRLVCADVGLVAGPAGPCAALVIEGDRGYEWSPEGARTLWDAPPP